ncbi:pinensin family lanthipeptide [Roseivirga sp. BDSF3-8]|uniref:pinensin family lanthipeptide n=1 Tax=Roseivirga sp. BDSF3-8 TaxID=3241598 RepID=UPI0035325CFE
MKKLKISELEVKSFVTDSFASGIIGGAEGGPTEHAVACPFTQALRDPLCQPTGLCINW